MSEFNLYEWRQSMIHNHKFSKFSNIFNCSFDAGYSAYKSSIVADNSDKIVIFGLPRSGNTWLQSLLSIILELSIIDPWVDLKKGGVGMCHKPLDDEVFSRTDFVHGICLLRDIRDIASSYFSYVKSNGLLSRNQLFLNLTPERFMYDYFFPRMDSLYEIENFWDKYIGFNLPSIRYEQLVENPKAELENLFLQLGISPRSKIIDLAIHNTKFSKLKKEGVMADKYVAPSHFGIGVVGSYKKILPSKIINAIEKRYFKTLNKWGYI